MQNWCLTVTTTDHVGTRRIKIFFFLLREIHIIVEVVVMTGVDEGWVAVLGEDGGVKTRMTTPLRGRLLIKKQAPSNVDAFFLG
jgi:hypothetical protein